LAAAETSRAAHRISLIDRWGGNVSPFIAMAAHYHFHVSPPRERIILRDLETDCEGPPARRDQGRAIAAAP